MTPEEAFALGQEFADLRKQLSQALTDVAEMQAIATERSEACERAEAQLSEVRQRAIGYDVDRTNAQRCAEKAETERDRLREQIRQAREKAEAALAAWRPEHEHYSDRAERKGYSHDETAAETYGLAIEAVTGILTVLERPEQSGTTSNDVEQGLPYCERHDAWHVATCEEWQAALDAREQR